MISLFVINTTAGVFYSTMSDSYSPYGVRWTFTWDRGMSVVGDGDFIGYRYFVEFSVPDGENLSLTSVSMALALSTSESNSENLRVGIYRDVSGWPSFNPDELLESWDVINAPTVENVSKEPTSLLVLNSIEQPTLLAGVNYYLTLEPAFETIADDSNDAVYYWYESDINTEGRRGAMDYRLSTDGWSNLRDQETNELPAFELQGITAVPEPTLITVGAGSLCLLFGVIRRYRKTTSTIVRRRPSV